MSNNTSTSVRIWGIDKYAGKRGTTYRARWAVEGKRFSRSFASRKQADAFRATLLVAAREAAPFDPAIGLPATVGVERQVEITWLAFVDQYLEAKWPSASPRHRKGIAEALTNITLSTDKLSGPGLSSFGRDELRTALTYGLFARGATRMQVNGDVVKALQKASSPVSALADPLIIRSVQIALSTRIDGSPAAERTATRKLATLNNVLEFAVELGLLRENPLPKARRRNYGSGSRVDPRVVVNPQQGRDLLSAVGEIAPHLTAYFALLLHAGMRPAEALSILEADLELPAAGWGRAVLSRTWQRPGSAWTDDGRAVERRGLKHRSRSTVRMVPLRESLVTILREHLRQFPCGEHGELFASRTGKAGVPLQPPYSSLVSDKTIYRAWSRAREQTLSASQTASSLGRRPYDLRHACLTHWLNAGVPPAQVATWAGHSTRVLLDVYAGCIDGGEDASLRRIEQLLGE